LSSLGLSLTLNVLPPVSLPRLMQPLVKDIITISKILAVDIIRFGDGRYSLPNLFYSLPPPFLFSFPSTFFSFPFPFLSFPFLCPCDMHERKLGFYNARLALRVGFTNGERERGRKGRGREGEGEQEQRKI
jgi:hypothetical protein